MLKIRYGTTTEIEYDGIVFHYHQPDFNILHCHDCYEFTLTTEGCYSNYLNGNEELLSKGSAILLGLNDSHKIKICDDKSFHLAVLIQKEKFESICNYLSPTLLSYLNANFPLRANFNSQTIFKILSYIDTIKIANESTMPIISNLLTISIIEGFISSYMLESVLPYPENFKKILIECNSIKNLHWKSNDVAEYANYSPTHLNRLFRKYLNMSVVEYLTKIKINASKNLLTTTNYSISEIAKTLGYSSISYFNKIFYNNFKTTPYQYKLNYFKNKEQSHE